MVDPKALSLPYLPRADKQIECQVVYPSGEQEPGILKKLRDLSKCGKAAGRFCKVKRNQNEISDRERERNDHGRNALRPSPSRSAHEQNPSGHCRAAGRIK